MIQGSYYKSKMKSLILVLIFSMAHSVTLSSQDQITINDYNRAVGFMKENVINKKAFNLEIQPNWYPDSSGVWFIHHSPDDKKYLKITFPDLQQSDLFDHKKLSKVLSDSLGVEMKANDLTITRIAYKNPKESIISARNKSYVLNTYTYSLSTPEKETVRNENEIPSPKNEWIAYKKDYNLFIKYTKTDEIKQLSTKGKKNYEYASWYGWDDIMYGENAERPDRFGLNWSEDSKWISTNICDLRSAQKMYLLDHSIDSLYRPQLLSYYRGSPGDTAMVYMEPVFFNIETRQEIKPTLPILTVFA